MEERKILTIEYNDGEVATYYAAPPEWAKWEKSTGKIVSVNKVSYSFGSVTNFIY